MSRHAYRRPPPRTPRAPTVLAAAAGGLGVLGLVFAVGSMVAPEAKATPGVDMPPATSTTPTAARTQGPLEIPSIGVVVSSVTEPPHAQPTPTYRATGSRPLERRPGPLATPPVPAVTTEAEATTTQAPETSTESSTESSTETTTTPLASATTEPEESSVPTTTASETAEPTDVTDIVEDVLDDEPPDGVAE